VRGGVLMRVLFIVTLAMVWAAIVFAIVVGAVAQ
jgi:hypothetical protein